MKATKQHIEQLSNEFDRFIDSLSDKQLDQLTQAYQKNSIRTMWNMYWQIYDKSPDFWRAITKDWKDSHIETMIKRSLENIRTF